MHMKVYCCQCKEWHDVDDVDFLDISEDLQGRDVMTFMCPLTMTEQQSNIVR